MVNSARPSKPGLVAKHAAKRRRRRFWLNMVAFGITLVVILAAAFWLYSMRILNIGSNSMAPTLRGTAGDRDHVLCWMLPYRYRGPRRWEVCVFMTPSNSANQEYIPGLNTGGESGMTIKRMVGIPGERLAMANGDIWTRNLKGGDFVRQVKPDNVQRGIWIPVYREDFSDVRLDEFMHYWRQDGDGSLAVGKEGLRMSPGGGRLGIEFQPLIRRGASGAHIVEQLPGIPDRYVLNQEVVFNCQTPGCGTAFAKWVDSQKIDGRCPKCGAMNFEIAVASYGFRSGFAEIGPYAVGRVPQADPNHFRANSYYFVPDLRLQLEIKLSTAQAACLLELREDERVDTLRVGASGMELNGEKIDRAPVPKVGEYMHVEFYKLDGAVRVYANRSGKPAFDKVIRTDKKPEQENIPLTNGVAVLAEGGELAVREVVLDRDIYYFSGSEHAVLNYLSGMEETGEVDIPPGHFLPLGDNTTVSLDGRSWGPLDVDLLRGTAIRIWRPKERAGPIPSPVSFW